VSETANESRQRELELTVRELAAIVYGPGPNKDNGLRSFVKKAQEDIEATNELIRDIWYNKRPAECLGLAALEKYIAECAAKRGDEVEVVQSKMGVRGIVLGNAISAVAVIAAVILTALLK